MAERRWGGATPQRAAVALGAVVTTVALALHSPAGAIGGAGLLVAVAVAPAPLGVALGQAAVGATVAPTASPTLLAAEAGLVVVLLGQTWTPSDAGATLQGPRADRGRAVGAALATVAVGGAVLLGGHAVGLDGASRYALVGLGAATLLYVGHRYEVVLRARAES